MIRNITLLICWITSLFFLQAQPYPDPEFAEKPMYYDAYSATLLPLERQVVPYKQISTITHQSVFYRLSSSPVRLQKADNLHFLVRLFNPIELDLLLFLYPLVSTKGDRVIKLKAARDQTLADVLPFKYKKVSDEIYMLTVENLPPGEYVWYLKSASYLFAVD